MFFNHSILRSAPYPHAQPSFSHGQFRQNCFGPASALYLYRILCTGGTFGQVPLVPAMIKTTFTLCIGLHRDVSAVQIHPLNGGGTIHCLRVLGCRILPELGSAQSNSVARRMRQTLQMSG
jgi:hypothetical protein